MYKFEVTITYILVRNNMWFCGLVDVCKSQKYRVRKWNIWKVSHCRTASLTNCISLQICRFAIYGTYLRTTHLCSATLGKILKVLFDYRKTYAFIYN
jgi:hypothetical protein